MSRTLVLIFAVALSLIGLRGCGAVERSEQLYRNQIYYKMDACLRQMASQESCNASGYQWGERP